MGQGNGLGCADCDTMRLGLGYLRGLGQDDTGVDISDGDVGSTQYSLTSLTDSLGSAWDDLWDITPTTSSTSSLVNGPDLSVGSSWDDFWGITPSSSSSTPTSSAASANETALLSSLASAWTKIAGQVIAPQTTIVGPNGLQVSTSAGQTSALSSILGSSLGGSSSLSALLPWILIGGAGLLAMKAIGGK